MVKYQFSKNWNWINDIKTSSDINEKHIDTVYRIDANPCVFGSCKTNCSTNPYCLNGLGEKKLANLLQKESCATIERNEYFRNTSEYAGLVNLGATCYINTYLQVWYNNTYFRDHIIEMPFNKFELLETNSYDQDFDQCDSDSNSEIIPPFNSIRSECIGTNLQMVFALMKDTIRKSIDPNFFIKALGLDENMQQDAQEFSQLFLTILQNSLSSFILDEKTTNSNNNNDKSENKYFKKTNIINELFQGECSYITECDSCKLQSIRQSNFIELSLNIQNSSTLLDCIDDLLKEESMDGDNQYYCDNCNLKRNAKRITRLTSLPPVLNLQLLRFVYDRNSGLKKKLSTRIKFSEILDLNSYIKSTNDDDEWNDHTKTHKNENTPKPQYIYHLGAILMHVGKTAYSGHYMAQIKNFDTNEWFNFNDEVITKIKRKQQLGCTEEELDSKHLSGQQQQQHDEQKQATNSDLNNKQSQKVFSTGNAYLLVYYRSDLLKKSSIDIKSSMVTSNQFETVRQDNERLEKWFIKLKNTKLDQTESKNTERAIITSIYSSLWSNYSENAPSGSKDVKNLNEEHQQQKAKKTKSSSDYPESLSPKSSCDDTNSLKITKNVPDRSLLYFISVEFLRRLLSLQNNLCSSDAASINSIQKYLCQHKRLNPLAINKFKLVSKEGLSQMMNIFTLSLNDIGALEAFNEETTRCKQCVTNCFEYLKCKEKLKQDVKNLKNMLKLETTINEDNNINNSNKQHIIETIDLSEQPNLKIKKSNNQNLSNKINKPSSSSSSSSSSNNKNENIKIINLTDSQNDDKNTNDDVIILDRDDENILTNDSHNLDTANTDSTSSTSSGGSRDLCANNKNLNSNCLEENKLPVIQMSKISPKHQNIAQSNNLINKNETNVILNNENKENTNLLQKNSSLLYWVGKESLKIWQILAIKKYESRLPCINYIETSSNREICEENNDEALLYNDIQEIRTKSPTSNESTNANSVKKRNDSTEKVDSNEITQIDSTSISFFNEDIICPHKNLSPIAEKRLVSSQIWHQIFEEYFYKNYHQTNLVRYNKNDMQPIFTNQSSECQICLRINEDQMNKNKEVKFQKEILNDLYYNKQRPCLKTCPSNVFYYLIMSDFLKEWRSSIKQSKFKDMRIFNDILLCQHKLLPFDQNSIDNSMITLLTYDEWKYLSENYEFDRAITVLKMDESKSISNNHQNQLSDSSKTNSNENNSLAVSSSVSSERKKNIYKFNPDICQECIERNELDKFIFENRKIFIRHIDEESSTSSVLVSDVQLNSNSTNSKVTTSNEKKTSTRNQIVEIPEIEENSDTINQNFKKPRIENDDDFKIDNEPDANSLNSQNSINPVGSFYNNKDQQLKMELQTNQTSARPTRRSKRTRKCKGDLEITVSSLDTIKNLKIKIACHLSRMVSEQHLYYQNVELENEKTLADYKINQCDILYLKLDPIANLDDMEYSNSELVFLPEIGFKGTNLLK